MRLPPLTLKELESWPHATVTPLQASGVLGIAPYALNVMARKGHIRLGSNPCEIYFFFSGNRLRIQTASLLAWCRADDSAAQAPENGA